MNTDIPYVFKKCKSCGEIKHINKFKKKKTCKFGVENKCKECYKIYNKKYRKEHKEEISKKIKEWKENNPDYFTDYYKDNKDKYGYDKQHYEDNKEIILKRNKKYKSEHKEDIFEYNKNYAKRNQDKWFNYISNRRTKIDGNGINQEQWLEMMEFFDWKCAYSGESMTIDKSKNGRTIDHIVALDNGGEHEIWNCVPMKKSYNSSKHTSNMLEWYLEQEFFSIERLTKIYEWRIYTYWKYKK